MIGKLKGVVDEIGEDYCLIDVGGVGYLVYCPVRTLSAFSGIGAAVTLFIETYVREDLIRLYGFMTSLEREWFRLLMSNVQGVGARVALSVLSTLSPGELANAIALKDIVMVSRAPGVGKKVAERIITELKNKAPAYVKGSVDNVDSDTCSVDGWGMSAASATDAISVLSNLGYSHDVAVNAVMVALRSAGDKADAGALVRLGLKELAR